MTDPDPIPTVAKPSDLTKRTTITLPGAIYEALENWAEEEGRPTANLAAYLVEQAIRVKYPEDFPPRIKRVEGDRHE